MSKEIIKLALLFLPYLSLIIYGSLYIYPPIVENKVIFLRSSTASSLLLFVGMFNIVLIWIICKKLFNQIVALTTTLLYITSPWIIYATIAESAYLLFIPLILISMWLWLKKFKLMSCVVFFMVLLTIFYLSPITVTGDLSVLNPVNTFRGELEYVGFSHKIGVVVENKYVFIIVKVFLNLLDNLSPVFYFTSEKRLLGFSAFPPILFGFLLPFLFGIKPFFQKWTKIKILGIIFLILPSALYISSPDLNRLVVVCPFVFLIIAFGFYELLNKKYFLRRYLLALTFIVVIIQMYLFIGEVNTKELIRIKLK